MKKILLISCLLLIGCARQKNEIGKIYTIYNNVCKKSKEDCYSIDSQGNTMCDYRCLEYHCYKLTYKKAKYAIKDEKLSYEFLSHGKCQNL